MSMAEEKQQELREAGHRRRLSSSPARPHERKLSDHSDSKSTVAIKYIRGEGAGLEYEELFFRHPKWISFVLEHFATNPGAALFDPLFVSDLQKHFPENGISQSQCAMEMVLMLVQLNLDHATYRALAAPQTLYPTFSQKSIDKWVDNASTGPAAYGLWLRPLDLAIRCVRSRLQWLLAQRPTLIRNQVPDEYSDVFGQQDRTHFENGFSIAVVAVVQQTGHYLGHIYAWPEGILSETLQCIGIRKNLMDFLLGQHRDKKLVPVLMAGVNHLARTGFELGGVPKQRIRIQHPIGRMPQLLAQCGFVRERVVDFGATPDSITCAAKDVVNEPLCTGTKLTWLG